VSNYVKSTNFAVKDSLLTGNPAKLVKGTEIDTEFNAISTAISSKLDSSTDLTIAGKFITSSNGSAAAPVFTLASDPNTGIYFPSDAETNLAIALDGEKAFEIESIVYLGEAIMGSQTFGLLASAPDKKGLITSGRYDSVYGGSAYNTSGGSTFVAFQIEDTEKMRIQDNGNVGIGLTNPTSRMHILNTGADAYYSATSNSVSCQIGASNAGQILFTGAPSSNMAIGTTNSTTLSLATNGTNRITVRTDGEIHIANPGDQGAYNLQVGGTGVWGAGAYVNGSDARLKEDIQSIASGLDVVIAMRPVTFKYKEDYSKDQSIQTGFIAQELKEVLKDTNYVDGVVQQGPEYLNVAYQNIIPLLTKAIQELKAELDAVKATLKGN
jgi:hypothetical protein